MRSTVALKILLHDKATTAGSLIGVIAIVFLVGQQMSVLFGLFTYMSVLVDHSGADIWVCSKNTVNINSAGSVPVRYVDRVSALPEISWVEPLLFGSGTLKTKDGRNEGVQVIGLRFPRGAAGPWEFTDGSISSILEYEGASLELQDLSKYGDPKTGDIFEINDIKIKVTAITKNVKGFSGRMVFTNMVKAREILKKPPGRCSAVLIKLRDGVRRTAALERIREILPDAEVLTSSELSRKTRLYYVINTGMGGSFGFSTLVGAMVGIIIITLTMYTAVLQRQKDFAVLRALGARKIDIFIVVLSQSMIIAVVGIFIGFLLLAWFLHGTLNSPLPSYMPRQVAPMLALGTLALCMAGSLLAMRKAISVEPASVFR